MEKVHTDDQELKKLDTDVMRAWLASLQLHAHNKGYQRGWVYHTVKEKFKMVPPSSWPAPASEVSSDVKGYIKHLQIKRAKSNDRKNSSRY